MSDPRPEPRYGQYADVAAPKTVGPNTPASAASEPDSAARVEPEFASRVVPSPVAPVRRSWDVMLTAVLLALGVYDVVTGFSQYANLSLVLNDVFAQQGIGEFTSVSAAATVGLVVNSSRIVLIVVALGWSLTRLSRGRIAFWVPLGAGLVAAAVALIGVFVLIAIDPAFALFVAAQQP